MDLTNSELYIALSSAVGTDTNMVIKELSKQLKEFNYDTDVIKISRQILQPLVLNWNDLSDSQKPNALMDKGNELRRDSNNDAILACSVSELIHRERPNGKMFQRRAFIISSLKHPSEVDKFREIYSGGFFLIAINENEVHRIKNLNGKNLGDNDAEKLIKRDSGEKESFGQHTRDVFEIADFHITLNCEKVILQRQIGRILDLIFGNPFITPTFDEYAMFMAYSSGLRSADLSRQVGAVIANKNNEIVATGANDVPKFGGGQYWPDPDNFKDHPNGRDYLLGYDSNKLEHQKIIKEIVDLFDFSGRDDEKNRLTQRLATSSIRFLTEYNRAVHAEMSAIVLCARIGISLQDATLYCTTFPCHNCAKHIIGTGIKRVVYIEP